MADESTNTTTTPERPEWATRIIDALQGVRLYSGDGRLTEGERDLVYAIDLRLRHRLGEPGPDGPTGIDLGTLAAFVFERGVERIAGEQEARA